MLERLRGAGFRTVLLRVTEVELRRRHQMRQATQGWTNVQWLEWDLDHLNALQAGGLIDEVVSGEQDAASVAAQLLAFAQRSDVASRRNQAVEALDFLGIAHTGVTTLKDGDERQNGNWLVDTVDGEQHVLRRYHDRATSADIAYEHAVLRHLAAAGWVVPAPTGEAVEHGGRWFCVTRHVPGAPVRDESEAQRRRRGRDMAHIDVALRDLGEHLGQRPGWRAQHAGPSVHEDVDWDQCLAALGAHDIRLHDWAATAAAAISAELAAIGAAALPLTLLHGDFAEWNVHYLDGELAGVIDFALSHLDSRPYELAIARAHRSPDHRVVRRGDGRLGLAAERPGAGGDRPRAASVPGFHDGVGHRRGPEREMPRRGDDRAPTPNDWRTAAVITPGVGFMRSVSFREHEPPR